MEEDERQRLVGIVAEAHLSVSEVAFRLRRELSVKAPVLKAAVKTERELFQLKRHCNSSILTMRRKESRWPKSPAAENRSTWTRFAGGPLASNASHRQWLWHRLGIPDATHCGASCHS